MPEKILIVDDDDALRQEMACSMDEYDIIEARDGQEALKILSKPHEIGLVLLDVKMPGLSGTEVLKLIKKREKDIRVVMLTAFSSKDVIMDSLRGQADDYLEKPVDIEKLKALVEKTLEAKKDVEEAGKTNIEHKINRVKRYIERNVFKKVSLEDAARIVGLNAKYLSRVFGETAGMGFLDYKLKIKIDKAKEILSTTGSTISEISDKLGFMNPESFMRIFKKMTGKTPTKFRKKINKSR